MITEKCPWPSTAPTVVCLRVCLSVRVARAADTSLCNESDLEGTQHPHPQSSQPFELPVFRRASSPRALHPEASPETKASVRLTVRICFRTICSAPHNIPG